MGMTDAVQVYDKVKVAYRDRFDVEWSEPIGFNNTFLILIPEDEARKLNVKVFVRIRSRSHSGRLLADCSRTPSS